MTLQENEVQQDVNRIILMYVCCFNENNSFMKYYGDKFVQ